jgi:rod shape-determining protein MreD
VRLTIWERLDLAARAVFPFLVTFFMVLISAMPLRVPELSSIMPPLALVSVCYWSIYRPDLLPLWSVFLIGLLQDLLSGGPIGVATLTLISIHAVVLWQRRLFVSASFPMVWCGFMVMAAAALGMMWLLTCLGLLTFVSPRPLLFQYILTVAAYPCFSWLMTQGQRVFRPVD